MIQCPALNNMMQQEVWYNLQNINHSKLAWKIQSYQGEFTSTEFTRNLLQYNSRVYNNNNNFFKYQYKFIS